MREKSYIYILFKLRIKPYLSVGITPTECTNHSTFQVAAVIIHIIKIECLMEDANKQNFEDKTPHAGH